MTFKPARLLVLLIAVAAMPAMAQNVAVVNGKPIPSSRLDYIVKDVEARGRKVDDETRKQLKDNLLALEEVSQEAEKQGLGKSEELKEKIALFREQALAQLLIEQHRKSFTPKDAQIDAKYATIKADAEKQEEYKARHILVASEDEAKAIIVKLKGGAKFEDLAKEKSTDTGSASQGGDLGGWVNPSSFVPEFSAALEKLDKGQITDTPVKTKFGYHVIQLEDKRKGTAPALADIKPKLIDLMKEEDTQAYIKSIRDKAVVK